MRSKLFYLLLMAFPFFIPIIIPNPYILIVFILAMLYSILSQYFDLLFGYINILNFGYAAIFGVGAYAAALLSISKMPSFLSIVIGALFTVIIALPIGLICLRLRGSYMAIGTLLFGEILRLIIARPLVDYTRGYLGLWGIPPLLGTGKVQYYYPFLILLLILTFFKFKIINSKIGYAIIAIREDEVTASSIGIHVVKYKLLVFVISAFISAIMGGFYAHYFLTLTPAVLEASLTFEILAFTLVGGYGTILGPVLGAFSLTFISEIFRFIGEFRFIIYGIIVLGVMLLFPRGLIGIFEYAHERLSKKT
jgi:branched-chain amino acid transport system permease protein